MRFRFYPLPFISLPLLPRVNAESEAQLLAIQPNFPPFVETKQFFARAPHPRISNHPAINFPPLPQLPSYRRASVRTHLNLKQEQDFKFIFEILGNEWPHKFLDVFFFCHDNLARGGTARFRFPSRSGTFFPFFSFFLR